MLTFDHLGDSQIFTATDRLERVYRFRVRRIIGRKATVYLLVCETGRPLSSAMTLSGAECAVRGLLDPTLMGFGDQNGPLHAPGIERESCPT